LEDFGKWNATRIGIWNVTFWKMGCGQDRELERNNFAIGTEQFCVLNGANLSIGMEHLQFGDRNETV
jgi:hypothetical protein